MGLTQDIHNALQDRERQARRTREFIAAALDYADSVETNFLVQPTAYDVVKFADRLLEHGPLNFPQVVMDLITQARIDAVKEG